MATSKNNRYFDNMGYSFKIKLRPKTSIIGELLSDLLIPFEELATLIAKNASEISIIKGIWDTGANTASIGITASPKGSSNFGPVTTLGAGTTTSAGIVGDPKRLEFAIVTTSGYGGWQEVGTRRFSGRDYITPAAMANIKNVNRVFKDTVK